MVKQLISASNSFGLFLRDDIDYAKRQEEFVDSKPNPDERIIKYHLHETSRFQDSGAVPQFLKAAPPRKMSTDIIANL